MELTEHVQAFVTSASQKLAAGGNAEANIRKPVETFLTDVATEQGFSVVLSDEDSVPQAGVRPDWSLHADGALAGYVEAKSPGKGADPSQFTGHDADQWSRLEDLPNVLLTDGIEWAHYRHGGCIEPGIIRFSGELGDASAGLAAPGQLGELIERFVSWVPSAPQSASDLAETAARLCRLLRNEVAGQLQTNDRLHEHAEEWRKLLFADADDDTFADGFAQTVTFALLLARVEKIEFPSGDASGDVVHRVARSLGQRHAVIGRALELLTDPLVLAELGVSIDVLLRVFSVVDWHALTGGTSDAWLLFYEDFLERYDKTLRQATGSYYTEQPLVDAVVGLVDDLVAQRLGASKGLATPGVRVLDPAAGTGTFLLSALRRVEDRTLPDGAGKVPGALLDAADRFYGFELQVGPHTVGAMRLAAELEDRAHGLPPNGLKMYVVDTLDDHRAPVAQLGAMYRPLAQSLKDANRVKDEVQVLVALGNPPYKVRSQGEGGWIEHGGGQGIPPPLYDWWDSSDPSLTSHLKHLYNPYIYFWRWAAWKVFEHHQQDSTPHDHGIVAFVSAAGFLTGQGFKLMRRWLREHCDTIFVIDLTPEGHQPLVSTRPFRDVQQPVCVCIALRTANTDETTPATVKFRSVSPGPVASKYSELAQFSISDPDWLAGASGWDDPLLPAASREWASFAKLEELLLWSGSGIMTGRIWVYAPEPDTLRRRWSRLVNEGNFERKQQLFNPHMDKGKLGDRHLKKEVRDDLPGYAAPGRSVHDESDLSPREPIRVAYRSFDRAYLIPDKRLINRDNPALWQVRNAPGQCFLTAPGDRSPGAGPAATFTSLIPDMDHFDGRGGRAFPLWLDASGHQSNVPVALVTALTNHYGHPVAAEEIFAYLAALLSSPAYTERFGEELRTPGLRVPITANRHTFTRAVELGRQVIWLHSFGQSFTDASAQRPSGAPRVNSQRRPMIRAAITKPGGPLPARLDYDSNTETLYLGDGEIRPVKEEVYNYQVGRMNVLRNWLDFRWAHRDTRATRDPNNSSPLNDTTHTQWQSLFDDDLINILNVLTLLVDLHPHQATLLENVCNGTLIDRQTLEAGGALAPPRSQQSQKPSVPKDPAHGQLWG
jgi:hypothetical protein